MNRLFHSHSFRYALALWLATVLALLVSFFVQLEPAQWSAITVWIIFMQDPRLNYSKIIWWAFGTIVGALAAVLLIVWFNQMPALGIAALALWLAVCSGSSRLVTSYRAYGLVLAGYTCAIVTMSAVDQPDQIFHIAITRVSCIAIGMTAAVLLIFILLPKHRHWRETLHHLGEHLKACLSQAAKALGSDAGPPPQFTWRHLADRLSTLEHTLDLTTAESADSRIHAPQARSLVATLFDLLAKAQAIEVHLTRIGQPRFATALTSLLADARTLLTFFAGSVSTVPSAGPVEAAQAEIEGLRQRIADRRRAPAEDLHDPVSERFVLDRLEEILKDFDHAIQDWAGLFGPWTARRVSHLAEHRDYPGAVLYGFRMFLTINLAGVFWSVTRWPSGSQFVLFIAVVCSLLSLVDYAPRMGLAFIKSAIFCAIAAYVEAFCLLPKCQGFLVFAFMLGLFLLPAAYAYRHPRLLGSAVVSMLIFYGLTMPANAMDYNIAAFLNNGIALL
ncbi:MAG TPA: FUSC family protein, partial [Verrucomicrobiae bacterium]|nr:FUSC family protein [Verrucomicrobiae bacterium]